MSGRSFGLMILGIYMDLVPSIGLSKLISGGKSCQAWVKLC